jgi:carbonic anhydrase
VLACASPYETIKEDVAYLRKNPLVRKETRITGVVYDLSSGITHEVVVA